MSCHNSVTNSYSKDYVKYGSDTHTHTHTTIKVSVVLIIEY